MEQQATIQPTQKLKIFPLYMEASGCDYHRVRLPFLHGFEYVDDSPYKDFDTAKLLEYIEASQIVVVNRTFPLGVDQMKLYQQKGVKFVVDLDDWVVLPEQHPLYKQYRDGHAKLILDAVKAADCVTVTTDRLYNKVREFNYNTHVIPNALPYGKGQFRTHPAPEDRTGKPFNFVYTGQSSHLEDVRLLQSQVYKMKKLPGVSFSLAGFKEHKTWRQIEEVFRLLPGYTRIGSRPLTSYMTVYDDADCSIVPLCLNDFNACKSNLKLLEAASKKLPVIVSWVPPYRDDADAPVLWVKKPEDWHHHMKYLSENRDVAKRMGQALHDWAFKKYNLDHWNKVRFELYQRLVK